MHKNRFILFGQTYIRIISNQTNINYTLNGTVYTIYNVSSLCE